MQPLADQATPTVESLLQADETELYRSLGLTIEAMRRNPSSVTAFESHVQASDLGFEGMSDIAVDIGRRIFRRWNKELHKLVCGQGGEDQDDRKDLLAAFGRGDVAVGAVLASILVSSFGVSAAVAGILSAIVMKRFFNPAYEEFCQVWASHFD